MISFVIDLGAVSVITIVGEMHKGISCRGTPTVEHERLGVGGRRVGEVPETNYFVTIFVSMYMSIDSKYVTIQL